MVLVRHIQNTVSVFGLPNFGLFHKEEADKLERVRQKVTNMVKAQDLQAEAERMGFVQP